MMTTTASGNERAPGMAAASDIYTSILQPSAGGPFLVIVSAFPVEPNAPIAGRPHRSAFAATLPEAERTRDSLIATVRSMLEAQGSRVRRVMIR